MSESNECSPLPLAGGTSTEEERHQDGLTEALHPLPAQALWTPTLYAIFLFAW